MNRSNRKWRDLIRERWFRWALYLLLLTVVFALAGLLLYSSLPQSTFPRRARLFFLRWLLSTYFWGLSVPLVVLLSLRVRLGAETWKRRIWFHLVAAVLFTLVQVHLVDMILRWFEQAVVPPPFPFPPWRLRDFRLGIFLGFARNFFNPSFFIYWLVLSATYVVDFYRKFREREFRASQLEAELARARLQALKNQLHPHFLFNALHTLSALVYQDARAADKMIRQLSELLRMALETAELQKVPLRIELDFLETYLDIMKTRFKDRLRVEMKIDPVLFDAAVPNLLLQPLVENAVKHGVETTAGEARIEIAARKRDGMLHIEVTDNGPGFSGSLQEMMQTGVGLRNTHNRLQQLYGAAAALSAENLANGGLKLHLHFPYTTIHDEEEHAG